MGNVELIIAILGLLRELIKLTSMEKVKPKTKAERINNLTASVKKAREEGDTSDVEAKFRALGIPSPK